jgi:hypothetical protein
MVNPPEFTTIYIKIGSEIFETVMGETMASAKSYKEI